MKNAQINPFLRRNVRKPLDHSNYLEWITDGSIENCSKLSVGIKSLEDLVKLAIDLHTRVIHDSRLGKYFVLTENMTYIHDPRVKDTMLDKPQLGKLLVERGLLQPQELETGLYYQKRIGCKLGDSLIALGFIDETILYSTLAAQHNLSYYELQTDKIYDSSWLTMMSINKARALQALPMGYRTDGKMMVACGDPFNNGAILALKEALGLNIDIVAARPSQIYEILQRIEKEEKEKNTITQQRKEHKPLSYERLSEEEWVYFMEEYMEGRIDTLLLMKASGFVNENQLAKAPNKEFILGWLTARGLLSGQTANLVISLAKLVGRQNRSDRQLRRIPELLELLQEAYYIKSQDAKWIYTEHLSTNVSLRHLLESNYLVARETIANAQQLLESLKSLVMRAKIS